ncbi:MAG: penicillin-binding protein 2 [Armatimonadetes bacterium]|nr:penicillin-binding protein 2 [Armatimonadota bacterium]
MGDPARRLVVVQAAVAVFLGLFLVRLWELQLTQWVTYARKAAGNRTQVLRVEPPRGLIFDRNGVVLAENRACWQVGVDPVRFPSDDYEADQCLLRLAGILGADVPDVRQAVHEALAASPAQPVPLQDLPQAEGLDLATVARIEEHRPDLPGIVVLETQRRYYPHHNLAAHLLGYARSITAEQYKEFRDLPVPAQVAQAEKIEKVPDTVYSRNSITGQAGVERLCELDRSVNPPVPLLTGLPGRTVLEVDVRVQPVRVVSFREPQPGASVYLTLDAKVQQAAEKALSNMLRQRGRSGAVVVLDVNTGEVLALCSRPSFDPNKWVTGFKPGEWKALNSDPRTPLLNTAIGGAYPPGSTFKIISALAALESTGLKTTTTFHCAGRISVGHPPTIYRCWKSGGHGYVDFWRGIAESCDVYFYDLVRKAHLTPETLSYWARQFGLGEKTGCGLSGEVEGLVPTPDWKMTLRHERWRLGDTLNMVIGQGDLTVTPLQMAVAVAALANGGKVYRPLLVRKIYWPAWMHRAPRLAKPELVRQVTAKAENLAKVRRGMRLAVASDKGTAHSLASFPVPCAGKTGSAEHRPGRPTHAWFVCFAPYDHPRYAVVVFVDSGGHGSSTAVPVARKVLAALFGVQASPPSPASSQ